MEPSTVWWLMAGIVVVLELLTGTFYLLMVSLGLAAGAIAAHLGASQTIQFATTALVGSCAVLACYWSRKNRNASHTVAMNPDLNLDIGTIIQVPNWQVDGTATVHHRGAQWTAQHRPGVAATAGPHRIAELVGNRLVLEKV